MKKQNKKWKMKKRYRPLSEIDLKWSLITGKEIPVVEINRNYYVDIEREKEEKNA